MRTEPNILQAIQVLEALGMPRQQQNKRTALCLLALIHLGRHQKWKDAQAGPLGITPMMDFARTQFGARYKPNTRESFRRQSIHQLVQAGIVLQNPDQPSRPVNSPKTFYQIAPTAIRLLRKFGLPTWSKSLAAYLKKRDTLAMRYAQARKLKMIPVKMKSGQALHLTPGKHSQLIRAAVEEFVPRFLPGADLLYVSDTGKKWAFWDERRLCSLSIHLDEHGKMPDVVAHDRRRNWLVLVEVYTNHGPVSPKRHAELKSVFSSSAGLVYVTAFPSRAMLSKHVHELAWETEVWIADDPDHLIHLNGSRFLGPYEKPSGKRGDT